MGCDAGTQHSPRYLPVHSSHSVLSTEGFGPFDEDATSLEGRQIAVISEHPLTTTRLIKAIALVRLLQLINTKRGVETSKQAIRSPHSST
jgi:hypothetical protein